MEQFMTFIFAGTDTTSHLTTMMAYELAKKPDILRRIRNEIITLLNGRKIEDLEHNDLNKMEIMQCFINETLRLYPPGPFSFLREAIVDTRILDL